ncbi:MAG: SDR family oxidoreductase [Proteobacteria bacterium]|nr:SDR family oxidoreductase [Pseudomonadota bacterium]
MSGNNDELLAKPEKALKTSTQPKPVPVAVVGVASIFPGSNDVQGHWRDIMDGRNLVTEVPPTHFLIEDCYDPDPFAPDKSYCKTGAFIPPTEFDPMEYGVPPTNLASTDTSQLLALVVAKKVLMEATKGNLKEMDRSRISVILGVAAGLELLGEMAGRLGRPIWVKSLREEGIPEDEVQKICDRIVSHSTPWKESTFPGLLGNVVAGRIANHFDLGGINCTSDAACASSFSAMSQALDELYLKKSDLVITGGVDTNNDPFLFISFSKTPALSLKGDCRPFSDQADGMVLGEGIGMVALKRLDDAERDGNRIYAVIRGIGASSDGAGTSIYAPLSDGQAKALRRCYSLTPYSPDTVELMEAHGTGTSVGDMVEVEGLTTVFDKETGRKDRQWCALGSIKSQIGHTKSTAAAAGLIKVIMGLHHKVLPPTIKVDKPDPKLELEKSAFYLNTQSRPWIRDDTHPRRASVSSFGFGGTNFHATVEEYRGPGKSAERLRAVPSELIVLSADNSKALCDLCLETAKDLNLEGVLCYLARTTQESFDPSLPVKLSIVASDEKDLENKLNQAAKAISKQPDKDLSLPNGINYAANETQPGSIAFLFPGQGSQYIGMGADLAMQFSDVMNLWDLTATLDRKNGAKESLHKVVFPLPVFTEDDRRAQSDKLMKTQWAQPAILTTSLSMSRLLSRIGIKPDCVGGHSLGEITALFDSGVLDIANVLDVCRKRGALMGKAAESPGSMTAVVHSADEVERLLKESNSKVIVANYNHPRQVVLSGPTPDIENVEQLLKKEKITFKHLPVSAAFHSSLMSEACGPFQNYIKGIEFNKPKVPIYSNVTGTPHPDNVDKIRDLLAKQLNHPVQFTKQIDAMYESGARTFVEVGPGSILTKLVGQCLKGRPHAVINMDTRDEHGITSMWKALGKLVTSGVSFNFSPLWEEFAPLTDPRKKEKPKFSVELLGCNYQRRYPPPEGPQTLPKPNPPRAQTVSAGDNQLKTTSKTVESGIPSKTNTVNASPGQPLTARPVFSGPQTSTGGVVNKDQSSWIAAYQEIQRQTAEAHSVYQKTMAESHMSFLRTVESSNIALSTMLTGQAPLTTQMPQIPAVANSQIMPDQISPPQPPAVMPATVPAAPPIATQTDMVPAPMASSAQFPGVGSPVADPASAIPDNINFKEMLLDVVAEKTGYPKEILELSMGLESDLGIDSIKRVEIFSAVKDENPWLPEVDPSLIGDIKTLGDVVEFIEKNADSLKSGGKPPEPSKPSETPSPVAASEVPLPATSPEIGRYVLKAIPAPHSGFALKGLSKADPLLVTDDETGVAPALVDELKKNGIEASVVQEIPEQCGGLIFLGGLRKVSNRQEAVSVNKEAFLAAQKIAKRFTEQGGVFVTLQNTGGDFGISGNADDNVWLSGLSGLAKTASIEWPRASVKAIDLECNGRPPEEIAKAVCRELIIGGPELEVGLKADGSRYRLKSYSESVKSSTADLIDENAVIVASGGARGITAKTLIQLAKEARPRLILLGRTQLTDEPACCQGVETDAEIKRALLEEAKTNGKTVAPSELGNQTRYILANREIKSNLETIKESGSEVRYVVADVQNESEVAAALETFRKEWGPITGIVHGAGVLADKLIAEKTEEQFDRVFNTKVQGLEALLKATASDPIKVICLFSSIAGRCGNMGQSDYSMANEILNKVANREAADRKGECLVKSINWGPWDGGMVSPLLKEYFKKFNIPLIPVDVGVSVFTDELKEIDSENVEIVIGPQPPDGIMSISPIDQKMNLGLRITEQEYPFIDSHRIGNVPVVPVAMILEWFTRAARLYNPDMKYVACRDLKVLRGIKLDSSLNGGDRFTLCCRNAAEGNSNSLALEIPGPNGAAYYTATVEMTEQNSEAEKSIRNPVDGLSPWPWNVSEIYNGKLFHGPELQVIHSLEGISDNTATAMLNGTEKMAWTGEQWSNDIAALDGGLQLAILWGIKNLGKKSLPTKIGAHYSYHKGPIVGPVYCELHSKKIGNDRTVSDISFFSKDGILAAKLCDVEMHMLPDAGGEQKEIK